jgi:hypothetical protein
MFANAGASAGTSFWNDPFLTVAISLQPLR